MHEEESVRRNVDAVIIRTGQLVLDPSAAFIKSLLRRVGQLSADSAHGALVTVLGSVPYFGETGLVSSATLHRISRHGKGSQSLKGTDVKAFTELMAKFKIPITVLTDAKTQERYLEYRTEDEQAVLTGLESCAIDLIKKERGLDGAELSEEQEREIRQEVESLADPDHELSVAESVADNPFTWEEVPQGGYETSVTDDKGHEIRCVVDTTGHWQAWIDGKGSAEGKRCLCTGEADPGRGLTEALLQASSAVRSLMKGQDRENAEKFALKTPEGARHAARVSISKQSGSTHDLGNRQHQGI